MSLPTGVHSSVRRHGRRRQDRGRIFERWRYPWAELLYLRKSRPSRTLGVLTTHSPNNKLEKFFDFSVPTAGWVGPTDRKLLSERKIPAEPAGPPRGNEDEKSGTLGRLVVGRLSYSERRPKSERLRYLLVAEGRLDAIEELGTVGIGCRHRERLARILVREQDTSLVG